jgi:hypothetical protein
MMSNEMEFSPLYGVSTTHRGRNQKLIKQNQCNECWEIQEEDPNPSRSQGGLPGRDRFEFGFR